VRVIFFFVGFVGEITAGGILLNLHAQMDTSSDFQLMIDEDVVEFARDGDDIALEYLINKYKIMIDQVDEVYEYKQYRGKNLVLFLRIVN